MPNGEWEEAPGACMTDADENANSEGRSDSNDQAQDSRREEYDLEERTARFAEAIIAFAKKVRKTPVTMPLITQLVKAGTSVGANYCEADDSISERDFRKNIGTCRKESKESKYWVRMAVAAEPDLKEDGRPLWQEAKELNLIFSQIFRSTDR